MQQRSLSQAIVHFIARLLPIYVEERQGESCCARSLRDGTLIAPVEEPLNENQEGWVRVSWQGDSARETVVKGVFLAQVALVDYIMFHKTWRPREEIRQELAHLAEHFELKTGEQLGLASDEPMDDLIRLTVKLADKLSIPAAIETIRRLLG